MEVEVDTEVEVAIEGGIKTIKLHLVYVEIKSFSSLLSEILATYVSFILPLHLSISSIYPYR